MILRDPGGTARALWWNADDDANDEAEDQFGPGVSAFTAMGIYDDVELESIMVRMPQPIALASSGTAAGVDSIAAPWAASYAVSCAPTRAAAFSTPTSQCWRTTSQPSLRQSPSQSPSRQDLLMQRRVVAGVVAAVPALRCSAAVLTANRRARAAPLELEQGQVAGAPRVEERQRELELELGLEVALSAPATQRDENKHGAAGSAAEAARKQPARKRQQHRKRCAR